MPSLRSPRVALTTSLAATVVLVVTMAAGCGVSPSAPEDRGDRLQAVAPDRDVVKTVPQPTAVSPDAFVGDFLMSTVGGGEQAVTQAEAFLTQEAADAWNPPSPELTVIHIVRGPVAGVSSNARVPVTVEYQVVGELNSQGRVDDLKAPAGGVITFWVGPAPDNRNSLRIEEIQNAPAGLLISDAALTELYRIQPVYFWDKNHEQLVPDLRYLPLTLTESQRAKRIVEWLSQGPSQWLAGVLFLPPGTGAVEVAIRDQKYVVNLSAQATAGGAETPERLLPQLQWSLANGTDSRPVELQIDGKTQLSASGDTFRPFNQAWYYRDARTMYDIVDTRVVPAGGAPAPPMLASTDNQGVQAAAINREATLLALVRLRPNGVRYFQLVKADGSTLPVNLEHSNMGRPSFIPGSGDRFVVVTAGGHLYLVVTATGAVHDITPANLDDVTSAVVAPDGRRIAFIAGGQAYVVSLVADGESLTAGTRQRRILENRVDAAGIAWLNETWLYVGGSAGGAPAMWKVSADGVVARDESGDLRGTLTVTDVVAGMRWPASQFSEVIIYTPDAAYLFGTNPTQTAQRFPFFGG